MLDETEVDDNIDALINEVMIDCTSLIEQDEQLHDL
jgi:hypothetical protein